MTKTKKSKPQSLSARRSSPRTLSKSLPEPNPSPRTHSVAALPKPNPSPRTNEFLRTPFSLGAITPIGTLKSISLSDWWLTKKEDKEKKKALSISGFESKGGSEVRLFSSGTIFKRHNSITLEAIDGITICINGFINRSRSLENGISNEVCNRFLLGFPYNWEDYNDEQEEEEIKNVTHTDLSISFDDDVPVSMLHDVTLLEGNGKILDDVVVSLRDLVCEKSRIGNVDKSLVSRTGDVDKSLVSRIVGVKTRGMLRRSLEHEASIGKRVHTSSKRKR